MLSQVRRDQAQVHEFPGRDWLLYVGLETSPAKNMTVGCKEEIIYIVSGQGELVTPEGTVKLEPGTAVYIPAGLHHATVSHGPGPMEMVTSFSHPPVVPGSCEKGDDGD
jgi:mannose-6-phosphate isomerase-like protein (cupin superfamily)